MICRKCNDAISDGKGLEVFRLMRFRLVALHLFKSQLAIARGAHGGLAPLPRPLKPAQRLSAVVALDPLFLLLLSCGKNLAGHGMSDLSAVRTSRQSREMFLLNCQPAPAMRALK